MDPAVKAAEELNSIFCRLEVPCEVCVTSEAGKHVKATKNLHEGFTLVEELPIVSWPSASLLHSGLPFCFHCLSLSTHQLSSVVEAGAGVASSSSSALPNEWTRCAQCASCFCSVECQQACARVHRLLCSTLPELRSPDSATVTSGISMEALARCVAWIAQRLSLVIGQQRLTHEALQADYMAQQHNDTKSGHYKSSHDVPTVMDAAHTTWSQDSLNFQLFTQVVAPFSRLISPPDSVTFDGVSLPAWMSTVRSLLAEKCVKLLLVASAAPFGKLELHPLRFGEEDSSDSSRPPAPPSTSPSSLYWAEALVQILFSTDTLRTLVGQMVLNAHGVNDYVLPAAGAGEFKWMLKGAGLYTLLSSFNHSCEPNAAVSSVDNMHDVALKTTRPVKAGEEITITYIPLTESTTLAERQQLLKNYFFTCRCPRCVREGKA